MQQDLTNTEPLSLYMNMWRLSLHDVIEQKSADGVVVKRPQ